MSTKLMPPAPRQGKNQKLRMYKKMFTSDMKRNYSLYLMIIPVLLFYIIFCYQPMYGAIIAFKDFSPAEGILGSDWVGLANFKKFFESVYFGRVLGNTLKISFASLLFSFPAPIILALFINELKSKHFSRTVQTLTYLPYFISLVVICGIIKDFTNESGLISDLLALFGVERQTMLNNPKLFLPIYVISDIWQTIGWNSIIYLAALTSIDETLYEAARVDGAGRWKQTLSITIPSILPTIVTMLILRLGQILNVGYEKIILLYNSLTMESADVITSFVYRVGLLDSDYGYSTAVGLFNSVVNFSLVLISNAISRKINGTSLW